jgi:ABC-2 type transport system ATP-binding protein
VSSSQPCSGPAISVNGLSKRYVSGLFKRRSYSALKNVSFDVARGEIFGYLGPNGSGKTTTLKLLLGLVWKDAGEIRILDHELHETGWRQRTGYLPEHPYFYDYLTPYEYMDFAGRLFGMPGALVKERTQELLALVGLRRSADVPLRRFSKGMVQRLGLAQAMLNDPELLFLDEPMSGLDPIGRRMVRDIILSLRERGKTVFFSTHILPDAETLCDRIGVLRGGELIAAGRLDEILKLGVSHVELLVGGLPDASLPGLKLPAGALHQVGDRLRLQVSQGQIGSLVTAVEAAGGRILSVQEVRQSLEDYFFKELGGSEAAARALESEL